MTSSDAPTENSLRSSTAFTTDSFTLAATLALRGHVPELRAGGKRVLFLFPSTPHLAADIEEFQSGRALVEPTAYDRARLELRRKSERMLAVGGAK